MTLLPKVSSDFSKCSYWDSFFINRKKEFEWYGDFNALRPWITRYMRNTSAILVVGAGNSSLSNDLFKAGYQQLVNVDISEVVVRQMSAKYPHLDYRQMDILQMEAAGLESQFDVVLDKGTLDALVSEDSPEARQRAGDLFSQVDRVLKPLGRYILVSLLEPYILQVLTDTFTKLGWQMHVQEVPSLGLTASSARTLPVFVVTCTKFKPMEGKVQPLATQLRMANMESAVKISTPQLLDQIRVLQNTYLLRDTIRNRRLTDDELTLELYDPTTLPEEPRFYLYILDHSKGKLPFAAFIVPQGWETEWLMSTVLGRRQLMQQCDCRRLVVVQLSRHHQYPADLGVLQEELKPCLPALYFQGKDVGMTFLAPGTNTGERRVRHRGTSLLSGRFVVEDVLGKGGDTWTRKLVFENRRNLVQTEAQLKSVKVSKGKSKTKTTKRVDLDYLASEYHQYMVACLGCLLPHGGLEYDNNIKKVLVLGLGGGSLPSFLYLHIPQLQVEVVEIDKAMVTVAQDWFALPRQIKVHVADALHYIHSCYQDGTRYDAILVDLDNKDTTVGMSCPPQEFVTEEFLAKMRGVLTSSGILVLNLAARDSSLASQVVDRMSSLYPGGVAEFSLPEDINRVVLALNSATEYSRPQIHACLEHFSSRIRDTSLAFDLDVSQMISYLSLH